MDILLPKKKKNPSDLPIIGDQKLYLRLSAVFAFCIVLYSFAFLIKTTHKDIKKFC